MSVTYEALGAKTTKQKRNVKPMNPPKTQHS